MLDARAKIFGLECEAYVNADINKGFELKFKAKV